MCPIDRRFVFAESLHYVIELAGEAHRKPHAVSFLTQRDEWASGRHVCGPEELYNVEYLHKSVTNRPKPLMFTNCPSETSLKQCGHHINVLFMGLICTVQKKKESHLLSHFIHRFYILYALVVFPNVSLNDFLFVSFHTSSGDGEACGNEAEVVLSNSLLSEDDCAHSIETWNEMLISRGERSRTLMALCCIQYLLEVLKWVPPTYAWKVLLKAYGKMNHFWVLTFCTGRGFRGVENHVAAQ
ncbi:unnamed protein product [Gadus morhua 'NCC']